MLTPLLTEIRACTVCKAHLPHGPRPVLQAGQGAKLVIIGQAPGRRVHETGIPWNDPSGDRLRTWLALSKDVFYDANQVALIPSGFCFPGTGAGGDLPPRPECAPLWHARLMAELTEARLALLVGSYAQAYYLGRHAKATLTETVAAYREFAPVFVPLPHPSPRNLRWFKRNPWFDQDVVPDLRARVASLLAA